MGANATTFVPAYVAGEVLTAADLTVTNSGVPVFADTTARDAAFGGSGEKVLAEGQLCYLESTNKVQYYDGSAWANLGSVTNVAAFTASGTWTVPTGVTYAIAHCRGGGGGVGDSGSGNGGTSSVAFSGGTVSATGGGLSNANLPYSTVNSGARAANSGQGAFRSVFRGADVGNSAVHNGGDGAYIVAGGAVTPAASITVTVGAGGTAGTNGSAGGSGYVWITYEV